ncbi:hypothetical protein AMECASPLE_013837 [Ameca splendens]|uniref:Uncharacterized protein n=1 Tax=Ameca splendens TaxID=208324 RepID=A0ABV0YCE1_9TELE
MGADNRVKGCRDVLDTFTRSAERDNHTIKKPLAKVCADTKMKWLNALPLVMFYIRSSPTELMGLTPHQLLTLTFHLLSSVGVCTQSGFRESSMISICCEVFVS